MTRYRLGTDYPREGFVQTALERHFNHWERSERGFADHVARDPESGRIWIIEAKGQTSDVGLDFRTGLGQIVQVVRSADEVYAIAVPDTAKFRNQLVRLSTYVRIALGLRVIRVGADGTLEILEPEAPLDSLTPVGG
jgi:hypothetical protein